MRPHISEVVSSSGPSFWLGLFDSPADTRLSATGAPCHLLHGHRRGGLEHEEAGLVLGDEDRPEEADRCSLCRERGCRLESRIALLPRSMSLPARRSPRGTSPRPEEDTSVQLHVLTSLLVASLGSPLGGEKVGKLLHLRSVGVALQPRGELGARSHPDLAVDA